MAICTTIIDTESPTSKMSASLITTMETTSNVSSGDDNSNGVENSKKLHHQHQHQSDFLQHNSAKARDQDQEQVPLHLESECANATSSTSTSTSTATPNSINSNDTTSSSSSSSTDSSIMSIKKPRQNAINDSNEEFKSSSSSSRNILKSSSPCPGAPTSKAEAEAEAPEVEVDESDAESTSTATSTSSIPKASEVSPSMATCCIDTSSSTSENSGTAKSSTRRRSRSSKSSSSMSMPSFSPNSSDALHLKTLFSQLKSKSKSRQNHQHPCDSENTSTSATNTTSTSTSTNTNPPSIITPLAFPKSSLPSSFSATSYQANNPCEDRYATLTNIMLQPQTQDQDQGYNSSSNDSSTGTDKGLIRMSMFCVLDGHGGPAVAEFASRRLLPLMVHNISQSLECSILQQGTYMVNGMTIKHVPSPNSNSNRKEKESESLSDDDDDDSVDVDDDEDDERSYSENWYTPPDIPTPIHDPSPFLIGMHSPSEQCLMKRTLQETFLQLDEEWMNGIDPYNSSTRQMSLVHNGRWNSGACCLVNVVMQRVQVQVEESESEMEGDEEVEVFPPILYSAHTGDCRSVLLSGQNTNATTPTPEQDADADVHSEYSSGQSSGGSSFGSSRSSNSSSSDSGFDSENEFHGNGPLQLVLPSAPSQEAKRRKIWNHESRPGSAFQNQNQHQNNNNVEDFLATTMQNHNNTASRKRPRPGAGAGAGAPIQFVSTSPSSSPSLLGIGLGMRMGRTSPSSPIQLAKSQYARLPVPSLSPLPPSLQPTELTIDHTPYNKSEADLVRARTNDAPRAIANNGKGGIERVGGSLSVTRALGDAYLKTPLLSFPPYREHAPYISALPEVSSRVLNVNGKVNMNMDGTSSMDRVLVLASDGVWERVSSEKLASWVEGYFEVKRVEGESLSQQQLQQHPIFSRPLHSMLGGPPLSPEHEDNNNSMFMYSSSPPSSSNGSAIASRSTGSRRMRMLPTRKVKQDALHERILSKKQASDMIVANILNRVKRKQKMRSVRELMALPKGNARRCRHDDITTLVIDLEGFVF